MKNLAYFIFITLILGLLVGCIPGNSKSLIDNYYVYLDEGDAVIYGPFWGVNDLFISLEFIETPLDPIEVFVLNSSQYDDYWNNGLELHYEKSFPVTHDTVLEVTWLDQNEEYYIIFDYTADGNYEPDYSDGFYDNTEFYAYIYTKY